MLILISSLMVWNKTLPKMREVDENGKFVEEKAAEGGEGATGAEETKAAEETKVVAEDGSAAPEDEITSSRVATQRV